ncbi:MAG: hypothetical protein QF767_17880, partial [Alphaproteobacteria bacterium]|nr:hypothetical protein [Alphaproteobacteria bacterium]
MSRIPLPEENRLDGAQRRVYDDIKAGRRGAVLDLFMMLLHSPELADRAQRLGVFGVEGFHEALHDGARRGDVSSGIHHLLSGYRL